LNYLFLDGPSNESIAGPSNEPNGGPSNEPNGGPSSQPTAGPSSQPNAGPSSQPNAGPSSQPKSGPSKEPMPGPSKEPMPGPSNEPTAGPSNEPTAGPSNEPTPGPSNEPTPGPSSNSDEVALTAEGNWLSYADLMTDSYPAKSKVVYIKAYKLLEKFLKSKNQWVANERPTELQVLNYFHYLRHDLKWAPTTLWSTYARINAVMKRLYGVSLNSWSRIGEVLKSYDCGYVVKKAGVFTPQQIEDFVTDPELSSKYWLVRKVVCLVGYYGGFRNKELKSLKFENCEHDSVGYWFTFARAKQRGRLEQTSICIPRRQPDWIPVKSDSSRVGLDFDPASLIDLYLAEIQSDLGCSRDELKGDFFRATHGLKGQKFTKLSLGKNTIGKVGIQVATELCLARPETFTGHCWRRSCGTSASDSGVNVTTLMAMMGWSNPKTAMVYVKKSRMTSLSLSLYLTNVQRQNCSDPFPSSPLEKRQAVKESKGSLSLAAKCSNTLVSSSKREVSSEPSKLEVKDEVVVVPNEDGIEEANQEEVEEINFSDDCQESSEDVKSDVGVGSGVSGGGGGGVGSGVSGGGGGDLSLNDLSNIDPRLLGILQNMQNSGSVTINFNFDGMKK